MATSPLLQTPTLVDAASTSEVDEIRPVGFLPRVVPETEQHLRAYVKCRAPARIGSSGVQYANSSMQVYG